MFHPVRHTFAIAVKSYSSKVAVTCKEHGLTRSWMDGSDKTSLPHLTCKKLSFLIDLAKKPICRAQGVRSVIFCRAISTWLCKGRVSKMVKDICRLFSYEKNKHAEKERESPSDLPNTSKKKHTKKKLAEKSRAHICTDIYRNIPTGPFTILEPQDQEIKDWIKWF